MIAPPWRMYMYMKPSVRPRELSPSRSGGGTNFAATGPSPAMVLPWQVQQMVWNRLSPCAIEASLDAGAMIFFSTASYGVAAAAYGSTPIVGTLSESGTAAQTTGFPVSDQIMRCGSGTIVWRMSRIG